MILLLTRPREDVSLRPTNQPNQAEGENGKGAVRLQFGAERDDLF